MWRTHGELATYTGCSQLLPMRMPGYISDNLLYTVKVTLVTGRECFRKQHNTPQQCCRHTVSRHHLPPPHITLYTKLVRLFVNTSPYMNLFSRCFHQWLPPSIPIYLAIGGWILLMGYTAVEQCHLSAHHTLQNPKRSKFSG